VRRWGRSQPQQPAESHKVVRSLSALPTEVQEEVELPKPTTDGECFAFASVAAPSCTAPIAPSVMAPRAVGPFKVSWIEKLGERQFEQREAVLRLDDPVPSMEKSEAVTLYRHCITAYYLRKEGWSKEKIAEKLQRAPGWVTLWWEKPPEEVPRPWDVPKYVADYNLRMLGCGIEPFRPAVLRRRYVTDTAGIYDACAQKMPWRQAVFRRRNYQTGGVTVTNIPSSRQDSSYVGLTTGVDPRLDAALARIRFDFNITDPRVYLLNNFYPDGNTSIAPHTHDFWSAILSFGASRVFTVDGHPLLLGDGDLLVIGTQRHAVPKMPEVKDGRVSVSIFWYPENKRTFWPALDGSGCAQCGRPKLPQVWDGHGWQSVEGEPQIWEAEDGNNYCRECFPAWRTESRLGGYSSPDVGNFGDDEVVTDDDLLAAALEISLTEY